MKSILSAVAAIAALALAVSLAMYATINISDSDSTEAIIVPLVNGSGACMHFPPAKYNPTLHFPSLSTKVRLKLTWMSKKILATR